MLNAFKRAFWALALGVLAIVLAVLMKFFPPYESIFNMKLNMEGGGEMFKLWAEPAVDLYIKVYLFNITNAEAFLAGRERMRVKEIGPYVYREIMTHKNVTFNANHTMSTNPSHPLVWQEHLSEGNREDDEVVVLNIAMLAISHLAVNRTYFLRMALKTLFMTSKSFPIVRMTAREFMFGYPSSLTTLGNTLLPNWISFEKVGLIDRMYDFSTDYETFHTGEPNRTISGLYATYRGARNLPHWQGHCGNIELASDGTKFKSLLKSNETVKFFRKSMCRPVNLKRVGDVLQYGSLYGYKYIFEENSFDNGAVNEKNKCYCRHGYCQPKGLIDVTDCYYGFPISLSQPHFLDGDKSLYTDVGGLTPNKENHTSSFIIQPQSGMPLSLSAKIQINMHFHNMHAFDRVARFSHLTVPMLWFDVTMPKLPDSLETRFNFYLNLLPYIDSIAFWGGLAAGACLFLYAIVRVILHMTSSSNFTHVANNMVDGKFSIAEHLHGSHGISTFNPCELKLMHTNEKNIAGIQQTVDNNNVSDNMDNGMMKRTAAMLYRELERQSSDESYNESNTSSRSQSLNSTAISSLDNQSDVSYISDDKRERSVEISNDLGSSSGSSLVNSEIDQCSSSINSC